MATKHGGPETRREEPGNISEKAPSTPDQGSFPRTDPLTGRRGVQTVEVLLADMENAQRNLTRLRRETDQAQLTFHRLQSEVFTAESRWRALLGDLEELIKDRAREDAE